MKRLAILFVSALILSSLPFVARAQSQKWKFMVYGDTRGTGVTDQINTPILTELARATTNEKPAFVLVPGDLVYSGTLSAFQAWTNIMAPVYQAGIAVYPVLGNHDTDDVNAYKTVFGPGIPDNGPTAEIDRTYFITYSNALVLNLDNWVTYDRVNQSWINAVLATNTRPHIFAQGHLPAFKANHADCLDDYPADRNTFWNSLSNVACRIYFCGHDHFYNHARINDGDGNVENDVHQMIVGCGGGPFHIFNAYDGVNSPYTPTLVYQEMQNYGYEIIEIDGNRVTCTFYHRTGANSYVATTDVFSYALPSSTAVTLLRGPYLQNRSHTNLTVRWRTDVVSGGVVRYGTNVTNLDLFADGPLTAEHEVKLTNLLPETRYYYSVGSTATPLAGGDTNHFFVTSPPPGARLPTRIWVISDAGGIDPLNQVAVRGAYEAFTGTRHTDLWLMGGDNAHGTGTDWQYQEGVFNIYTNLLRNSVVWPAIGNHDRDPAYFSIFSLPQNGEAGGFPSGTERYYSFDHANIHFICLDSKAASLATNSPMYLWLTNDLAQVTADWTIAFWHHPPFNPDNVEPLARGMREVFLPVLEQAGVDLVLNGHIHNYLRTFLLDQYYSGWSEFNATNKLDAGSGREGDTGAYTKPGLGPIPHGGTVYTVVGSPGALDFVHDPIHPAVYLVGNIMGSLVLDIAGDRLDAKFISSTGTTNDFFTIVKSNQPPVFDLIADQVVDANQPLVLTNFARDFVLPGEQLNFSLLSAPAGASIWNRSPTHAVFSWVPACEQGGTTNIITIQVSDNGTPPLTATQTFIVTVPDCVQVSLGSTVVRAGDTVSVPIDLLSTVPLSHVVVRAAYPAERFTNATLLINPQQIVSAPLFNLAGTGSLDVELDFQTNHTLRLSTNVATLGFTTFSNQSSAFVWLTLPDVAAQRLDGSVVTNAYGVSGRVVVVSEEPLLEALRAPGNQVLLLQYALPDSLIGLQWTTNMAGGGWESSPPVTQTKLVQEADRFTPAVPAMFFRALRGTNTP